MNKIPVTSTFLYEFDIDTTLADETLAFVNSNTDKLKIHKSYDGTNASDAVFMVDKDGKSKPFYYKKLFDQLQIFVDEICDLHLKDSKLVICDAWFTKSTFSKNVALHWHPYSIFSGLVYLDDQKRSETVFVPEDTFYKNLEGLFPDNVKKSNGTVSYQPKKGKVLIWRSDLPHFTNPHTERNVRYALAFNTWFTGEICRHDTKRLRSDTLDAQGWADK